jgi:ABC-type multidrug transport system fused ATPase/permease subunit
MPPHNASLRRPLALAKQLVRGRRREAIAALLAALAHRSTVLIVPLCARALVDGMARPRTSLFAWTGATLAFGAIFQAAAAFAGTRANARLGDGLTAALRERLVAHLLRLPVAYIERERTDALATRVQHGLEGLLPFVVRSVVDALALSLVLLVALPVMFALEPVLTALALGFGVLVLGVVGGRLGASRDDFKRTTEAYAALTSTLGEIVDGFRVIKGAGQEAAEAQRYVARSRERLQCVVAVTEREARSRFVSETIRGVLAASLLCIGALRVARGASSIGDLVAFGALVGLLTAPLSTIAGQAQHVARGVAALADASAFLELPAEKSASRSAGSGTRLAAALRFDRVSFAHPAGPEILHDVSLEIPAGALVGVVGESGAGKSTLLDLAARIHAPSSGRVLLDGMDVESIERESFRTFVASVGQDVFLFDRSVRANVGYAVPSAIDASIQEACEAASVWEAVRSFPEQLETRAGERGHRLSGGERQRLALARALLSDPSLLLLDEVTSNIDPVSEAAIAAALRAQRGRRTTVVVAHRASFVRDADLIVVLHRGVIIEQGTHDELLRRSDYYRDMLSASTNLTPLSQQHAPA